MKTREARGVRRQRNVFVNNIIQARRSAEYELGAAAVVALVALPFVPAGIPLLIVAILVGLYGVFRLPAPRGSRY